MATQAELKKAYDAGQAAQKYGVEDEACPFEEGTEEYKAYMDGRSSDLEDKWTVEGRQLTQEVGE